MLRCLMVFVTFAVLLIFPASGVDPQTNRFETATAPESSAKATTQGATAAAQKGSALKEESAEKKKTSPPENTSGKRSPNAGVPTALIQEAELTESPIMEFIPDDVFAVGAIQPAKLLSEKLLSDTIKNADAEDVVQDLFNLATTEFGLDPSKVVEVAFFIEHPRAEALREGQAAAQQLIEVRSQLIQVGLAMQNFHATNRHYPDDDGFGDSKGNLSWRVHLLPYLDQLGLYKQFKLDEPWDSEHNKALIEKIPDVFKVPSIKDAGKTTVHFLMGPGTPFGGNKPPTQRDITDGSSHTIMTVVGGIDTAQEWTKPGGLEVDRKEPLKALGEVSNSFLVGFMDGRVQALNVKIDSIVFLRLAQHSDGAEVHLPYEQLRSSVQSPGLIVRYAEAMDQESVPAVLSGVGRGGERIELDGHPAIRLDDDDGVMFPDEKIMLVSSEKNLKLMRSKRGKAGAIKEEFNSLYPANDAVVVSSLQLTDDELDQIYMGSQSIGLLRHLVKAKVIINATGGNKSLLHATVETDDAQSARQLTGSLNEGFRLFKFSILSNISRRNSGVPEKIVAVLSELAGSAAFKSQDAAATLDIPKAADPQTLLVDLAPAIREVMDGIREGRTHASDTERLNAIHKIGQAINDYHNAFHGYPSLITPGGKGTNPGLSWRVYLLPYLGEEELYDQFNLDEPWDSDHNRPLIARMPHAYVSAGVDDTRKTSLDVFVGSQTPFGVGRIGAIKDGLDTLMVVEAGPNKAEIWTKPSGLKYHPQNPKECLGNVGEKILVVNCQGNASFVAATVDNATLLRLIECNDGEQIDHLSYQIRPRKAGSTNYGRWNQLQDTFGFISTSLDWLVESFKRSF